MHRNGVTEKFIFPLCMFFLCLIFSLCLALSGQTQNPVMVSGGGGGGGADDFNPIVTAVSNTLDASGGTPQRFDNTASNEFAANYWTVGKSVLVFYGIKFVTPGTDVGFRPFMEFNNGGTNITLYDRGSQISLGANQNWTGGFSFLLTCRSTGPTGTIDVMPLTGFNTAAGLMQDGAVVSQPVTFDTTITQRLRFAMVFGGSTAGNTAQVRGLTLIPLN